jgi:hypothetical protein
MKNPCSYHLEIVNELYTGLTVHVPVVPRFTSLTAERIRADAKQAPK